MTAARVAAASPRRPTPVRRAQVDIEERTLCAYYASTLAAERVPVDVIAVGMGQADVQVTAPTRRRPRLATTGC